MASDILVRYSAPNKFVIAPFGTLCKVFKDDNEKPDLYIQISQKTKESQWETLGSVFEISFEDSLQDPDFMESCLKKYLKKTS